MSEEEQRVIEKAKELALENVNKNRIDSALPPIQQLEDLWWELYGERYIQLARKALNWE